MLTFSIIDQKKYKWLKNSDLYKNLNNSYMENNSCSNEDLNNEITDIFCEDNCSNLELFSKVITFWGFDFNDIPIDFYKLLNNESSLNILFKLQNEISDFKEFYKYFIDYVQSKNKCIFAIEKGNLEILKWLISENQQCPWNENTCSNAAQYGHLHVLQWLRFQDPPYPWNEYTCLYAAFNGHLNILQWARSQNPPCPWDVYTCAHAAENGHLHVLQWLRSQDPPCPWNEDTCLRAARYGHLHILQ
jgi:hypothetical protein